MLLLLFLPLFSFAGHLLSFISMGEVFGKVSNSQSQKTVNTWNIFSNMLWPVMHCPAPSLPSHPKFPRQLHVISQGKVMHSYSDNRNLDVTTHSMVIQFTKKLCYIVYRVCTGSWILEKKVLKLAQQFSRPRKSLENGYKVYKNGKSLFLIFFSKLQQVLFYNKCFMRAIVSVLIKSYSILPTQVHLQPIMKKALFLHFLRSLLITYLITLSLEKEIINCLEKKSGKSLKFWIQKSVQILCAPLHFDWLAEWQCHFYL